MSVTDAIYLGLDIGTSAVKLCAMDASGRVLATADSPLVSHHPFDGASEQDAYDWITATHQVVARLQPAMRARVAGIGLSGQMHGAVVLDAAKRPIRPVILWNDGRAAAQCAAMAEAEPAIGEIAGVPPMPGFTAPKLRWLAEHEPANHGRIRHVCLPKDFIGLYLHGALVTDPSDAAGTEWLDQAQRQWSPRLCEISATDPAWLPEILDGTAIAGRLRKDAARALDLPPGIPVATGAGDAAAGAVGIGTVSPGEGFISLGTSGQLFVTTDGHRPNPVARIHAYAHCLPGLWFQMAAMLNGARPMAWLAALLGRPIPELLAEAQAAAPGPVFLPYLSGERTPHGDPDIRAGFVGLSEKTSQGSLMRATLEGIAFSFADATEALATAGTRFEQVLAIGGGTRSPLLLQLIADATGLRIGRSEGAEVGPALGAARLAQIAAENRAPLDVAHKAKVAHWFEPDRDNAERLRSRLRVFRQLYPAVKAAQS